MKLIKHPNVTHLYEVMASKTKIYLVLEYVTGGELFGKISSRGMLREDEARMYFQQLINAVDYCHSRGVFHRDLKLENLLLDANGVLKVSDFGLSALSQLVRGDWLLRTTCGTPNYVAPEVIKDKGYDGAKADLWSCGVILFVLIAGYLPFEDSNLVSLYKNGGVPGNQRRSWHDAFSSHTRHSIDIFSYHKKVAFPSSLKSLRYGQPRIIPMDGPEGLNLHSAHNSFAWRGSHLYHLGNLSRGRFHISNVIDFASSAM